MENLPQGHNFTREFHGGSHGSGGTHYIGVGEREGEFCFESSGLKNNRGDTLPSPKGKFLREREKGLGEPLPLPENNCKYFVRKNIYQEGEKILIFKKRRGGNAQHNYYTTPAEFWKAGGRFCRCGGRHTRRGEKLTTCHSEDASRHKGSVGEVPQTLSLSLKIFL